jgi:hypothetical protein
MMHGQQNIKLNCGIIVWSLKETFGHATWKANAAVRAVVYNEPLVFGMQTAVDRQSVPQSLHRLRYNEIFNDRLGGGRLANGCVKFCMD